MTRTLAVARVHALDHVQMVTPWAVMACSFAINYVLWIALADVSGYDKSTGGLAALYVTALFMGMVALFRNLPFVLGMGVTRRSYLSGALLFAGALTLATGVLLTLLNRLEQVTSGFGQGGRFFRVPWFTDVPVAELVLVYAGPMLAALAVGALLAGIYTRFGATGMLVLFVALGAVVAGAVVVLTRTSSWPAVGDWLTALTPLSLTGWLVVVSAVTLAGTYVTLRRAPV